MTFIPKIIKEKIEKYHGSNVETNDIRTRPIPDKINMNDTHSVGVYYSNWSPYEPRLHFPHDIKLDKVSHVYYAFFIVDGKTGKIKSSDQWSDFNLDVKNPNIPNIIPGVLGELNYLKTMPSNNFKLIMAVGGWSNRQEFPRMVRSKKKMDNFISSVINTMFINGFDGVDLDWEFPKNDGFEPQKYLEICARLRAGMDNLENDIWGADNCYEPRFHLSMATPAFSGALDILPIQKMNLYISVWNMMTYDFHGEWSKKTGYHSNLYNTKNNPNVNPLKRRRYEGLGIENEENLNAQETILKMTKNFSVNPGKVVLGMAAYGRGFTNVKTDDGVYIGKEFSGVGGESEGEPGMWLYNQLPIKGTKEEFDDILVSAYCFDPKTKTFVGYDNIKSMKIKNEYIKDHELAGGFWWESVGDDHVNPSRSLLNAFTEDLKINKQSSLYKDPVVADYYLKHYPNEVLAPLFNHIKTRKKL